MYEHRAANFLSTQQQEHNNTTNIFLEKKQNKKSLLLYFIATTYDGIYYCTYICVLRIYSHVVLRTTIYYTLYLYTSINNTTTINNSCHLRNKTSYTYAYVTYGVAIIVCTILLFC